MTTIAYFGMPGGSEVILILFIILLLFGAKKLPELSRSLGKSLGEFKKGKEDLEKEIRDIQNDVHEEAAKTEPETEEHDVEPEDPVKAPSSDD
jgi:sec-independent protein translocase protein TatA